MFVELLVMLLVLGSLAVADGGDGEGGDGNEDRGDSVDGNDGDDPDKNDDPDGDGSGDNEGDDPDKNKDPDGDGDDNETDGENGGKGGSKHVPHARFNQVVQQREFFKEQYERLLAQQGGKGKQQEEQDDEPQPPKFDFDAKEDEYLAAVSEGKLKEAKQIRAEIRKAERDLIEFETEQKFNARIAESGNALTEQQKTDALVKQFETDFPVLKKGTKEFDQDLVNEVLEDYRERLAAGTPASKALERSVRLHLKAAGFDPDNPKKKGAEEGLSDATKGKQKQDARTRNADASQRQAPKLPSGKGGAAKEVDADAIDVENLTDEEFNALPEATKKKLRGD